MTALSREAAVHVYNFDALVLNVYLPQWRTLPVNRSTSAVRTLLTFAALRQFSAEASRFDQSTSTTSKKGATV